MFSFQYLKTLKNQVERLSNSWLRAMTILYMYFLSYRLCCRLNAVIGNTQRSVCYVAVKPSQYVTIDVVCMLFVKYYLVVHCVKCFLDQEILL